jgi:hypothetical protein
MAHYAFLNEDNVVTNVIVGIDEWEKIEGLSPEEWYGNFFGQKCIRTSYNSNIRKNYASIGFYYSEEKDAFIPPKPFESWVLNEEYCVWKAPVEYPIDENDYFWNEEELIWNKII